MPVSAFRRWTYGAEGEGEREGEGEGEGEGGGREVGRPRAHLDGDASL